MARDFLLIAATLIIAAFLFGRGSNVRECIDPIALPAAAYGDCSR